MSSFDSTRAPVTNPAENHCPQSAPLCSLPPQSLHQRTPRFTTTWGIARTTARSLVNSAHAGRCRSQAPISKRHVLVLGFLIASTSGWAFAQSVIHVPADYPTIQQAVDASADGDTVEVAPGTYYEQITFGTHQVTVESSDGPEATIIDATFLGAVVYFGAASTRQATIKGFTITHGKGTYYAGGIQADGGSPTIQGNIIKDNLGEALGNGISLNNTSALVIDNHITHNDNDQEAFGGGGGGGIGVSGMSCPDPSCGAEIRNNVIENNSVNNFTTGGGIYMNGAGSTKIIGNVIRGNSAQTEGGGIGMVNDSNPDIENNLIVGNQSGSGGGLYWLTPIATRGPFLINNTIVDNVADVGSGVYADGFDIASRIINNVIVAVPGISGIECGNFDHERPVILHDDVYAANGAPYAGLCSEDGGTNGNITDQPIFFAADDYRLAPGSPGIDAGLNNFATETTDLAGNPRIVDGDGNGVATIDMGAYELQDEIFANSFEPPS